MQNQKEPGMPGSFDVMPHDVWPNIASRLPAPWPTVAAAHDLRWYAAECAATGAPPPSLRTLAARWGWGKSSVGPLLNDYTAWVDGLNPQPWPTRAPLGPPEDESDGLFEHPGPLTHADVVDRALRWLRGHHGCAVAFAEINTYELVNPDAIGFRKPAGSRKGWSVLVEAKISRSDFRADREKMIHRMPDSCPGQERWYLTPPGMLRAEEIPPGWGLAEVGKRSVRVVVEAPKGEPVHGRAVADMGILLSAVRRHQVGAKWLHDLGKFEPYAGREG